MIKSLISSIILAIAVLAGGMGGHMLKTRSAGAESHADAGGDKAEKKAKKKDDGHGDKKDDGHGAKDDGHGKKEKKKEKDSHGKKDDKKGGHGDEKSAGASYLKFKRQFVIPVAKSGRIQSLVIMNFNIVLNDDAPGGAYTYEPKLRDAFTRELLSMSNDGQFGDALTSVETYEMMRERLLYQANKILEGGADDLLILDIAKQDQ